MFKIKSEMKVFHETCILPHAKCILKRWMFVLKIQGNNFYFLCKGIATSEYVYSRNDMGKITFKITGNVDNI